MTVKLANFGVSFLRCALGSMNIVNQNMLYNYTKKLGPLLKLPTLNTLALSCRQMKSRFNARENGRERFDRAHGGGGDPPAATEPFLWGQCSARNLPGSQRNMPGSHRPCVCAFRPVRHSSQLTNTATTLPG